MDIKDSLNLRGRNLWQFANNFPISLPYGFTILSTISILRHYYTKYITAYSPLLEQFLFLLWPSWSPPHWYSTHPVSTTSPCGHWYIQYIIQLLLSFCCHLTLLHMYVLRTIWLLATDMYILSNSLYNKSYSWKC